MAQLGTNFAREARRAEHLSRLARVHMGEELNHSPPIDY